MLRAIEDDQHVRAEFVGVILDHVIERRPAALFFTVENHLDVLRGLAADRIHRRDERLNRPFVVARGPCVDAEVIGKRFARRNVGNSSARPLRANPRARSA